MKKDECTLSSAAEGRKIHTVFFEPEEEPSAVVQLVHGMSEYIGRYEPFAAYLAENGIASVGHDHLGHGQSVSGEGDLGFFAENDASEILVRDMRTVTLEAKRRWPGLPVFMLGHSMGSFLARRYLPLYSGELSGAILMGTGNISAPLAGTGLTLARMICRFRGERAVSRMLGNTAMGGYEKPFASEGEFAWLSANPENVERYRADPLCGFPFTAGAWRDFFRVLGSVARLEGYDAVRRTLPILVISGEVDPVGGAKAVKAVGETFRRMEFTDVTEKIFPGDRHEIMNENDREEVHAFLAGWIRNRVR